MAATKEPLALKEYLAQHTAMITETWLTAVKRTSYLSLPQTRLRAFFKKLTTRLIEAIFEKTPEAREKAGVKIGTSLSRLRYLQPETLGETQKALWQALLAISPPFEAHTLHAEIAEVLSGISVGFFREARHEMLLAQENLHHAVRSALFASEQKFRQLTEIVSASIFIYQGTRFRYVNNWFKYVTGYSDEEVRQMNFWDVVHPDHRAIVMQRGMARQAGGYPPSRYEVKLQRKDGRILWVELSFAPIEFEGNDAVLGTAFDITERVESAERHKRLLEKVSRAEARQRALLQAIPDLVFRLDEAGHIIDYHTNFPELLFITPDRFLGKTAVDLLPPQTGKQLHATALAVARSGEPREFSYSLEVDGKTRYFEAHFTAGRDEILCAIRDVTTGKLAEQHAIRTERMAALGQLSAALAHELNNPLQAIQTNLDLILDFPLTPEEKEEYFHVIRHELKRVTELSQHILSFASPRPEMREQLMVADIINRVLRLWRKQLEKNGVTVTTNFHSSQPVVAAQHQLHQVFLNLILNAIDAIRGGKKAGTITITVQDVSAEQKVEILFANDGPPIAKEVLPHLFEPFFTTKEEGSGLGLWTSYNIIEQHGGGLSAENLDGGEGAIFRVILPAANSVE